MLGLAGYSTDGDPSEIDALAQQGLSQQADLSLANV